MQVKGSLTVKSILTAGRRANEGLNTTFIEQTTELDKYSSKHQYIRINTEQTLVLPDATTLPTGWGVNVYSSDESFAKLTINDHDGNRIYNLAPKKSVTLILLEKATTSGVWRVVTSGKGSGLGSGGNVPLYAENGIFSATDKGVESFTIYEGWNDGTKAGKNILYYTLRTTKTGTGGKLVYIWAATGSDVPLYTSTNRETGFVVYKNEACDDATDVVITTGTTTRTFKVSEAAIYSTYFIGGIAVNAFIANVMNGIDDGGDAVDETVFFEGGTAVSEPANFPTTKYIYVSDNGLILEESSRQRGGCTWPVEPNDGDIFFFKPLRRNYKYSSTDGWEDYPCTALGELTFVGSGKTIVREYPLNEWWWDYKYGDKRNTVIISSGTVLNVPDFTGVPVGTQIQGVRLGNVVATIADGFTPEGLPVDNYVAVPYDIEVPYTLGTATYYYLLPDGAIETSLNKPAGGDELPPLDASVSYADGAMFYSRKDGKNFKLIGGQWEEYPAVCVAYITDLGKGKVVPFNTDAFGTQVTPHSQTFLDANNQTTAVVVDEEIIDPGHLTVNVCNTVLQSNTYQLQSDRRTILFNTPIEPGLQIEVRWYIPADVTVVRQSEVSTVTVSDFNLFDSITLYSIVHTERDVTQHAPLNVTADWLVMYLTYGDYRFLRASQLDNPAATLYRTCVSGVWTEWSFAYAAWFPGI